MEAGFSTKSAQATYDTLKRSLKLLGQIRDGGPPLVQAQNSNPSSAQEGVKKFESLCRGVVSSVQELSLRIAKLSETDKDIRPLAAECRKILLEVSTSLMLVTSTAGPNGPKSPSHIRQNTVPTLVDSTLPLLLQGCRSALTAAEQMNAKKVRELGEPVLQTLTHLQRCGPGSDDLFLTLKLFGIRLLKFLESCSSHYRDFLEPSRQIAVISQAESIKKLAPYLVQTLRDALERPGNPHLRDCKDFFFVSARKSVENLMAAFDQENHTDLEDKPEQAGAFVKRMDLVLEDLKALELEFSLEVSEKVRMSAEWLVRFSLSVSKACPRDEADIFDACRNVVSELESLKMISNNNGATSLLRDALEGAEHSVNVSLLRLIVNTFSRSHFPLDLLVSRIIQTDRMESHLQDEIGDLIDALDDHNDDLFHAAHFSRFCATDEKKSLDILSRLQVLEILEKEMVPACHRLNQNSADPGAKSYLRTLRTFWKAEFDALEATILDIVDATALCAVIDEETRNLAVEIKKRTYAQDPEWLKLAVTRLIKMCQMGVDAAWKDASGGDADRQLPDDHPVIKLERATWEVRSALTVVVRNVEILSTHQALLRRVQLLASSMSNVVKFLVSVNDDENATSEDEWRTCDERSGHSIERSSSVRVLTSVSRVTIGSPIVSELTRRNRAKRNMSRCGEVSRVGTRSFRLNKTTHREEKFIPRRQPNSTMVAVDETLSKLTSLTPKLPFITRKLASQSGDHHRLELANNFHLSNILNVPRLSPIGMESPVTSCATKRSTRSPLKVITNSSRLLKGESLKYNIVMSGSNSLAIQTPERLADIEMTEKRLDLLLKTS